VALFMENMDSTVIATSLPAIAADIGTSPLALKLAITAYLLSLAVFLPVSGWTADRFGARRVFRAAIVVFMTGSIGCALSQSLDHFVIARFVQGMGGAMMTPVGRLVLVRSIDKRRLVDAMAWVSIPALVGPVLGPPLGGFITTFLTWHWIFLINIPIGLIGIALASRYIENFRAETREPFDGIGMLLAGLGIAGVAFGLTTIGAKGFMPPSLVVAMIAAGSVCIVLYVLHARRTPKPVIDLSLFRLPSFRAGVAGGFIFRVGAGAIPFLLPLMLQVGFGLSPFASGSLTFAAAAGAMAMKFTATAIIRRFGFRRVLIVNALISGLFLASYGLFTEMTPQWLILAALLVGGFFRSLEFTALNAIAFADIDQPKMSRATSFSSVAQQMSQTTGVAAGAAAIEAIQFFYGDEVLKARDFGAAFYVVALISVCSIAIFARLAANAGAEVSGRRTRPTERATAAAE
jgi:EmrB/QacA subfamily drug resistance transporter